MRSIYLSLIAIPFFFICCKSQQQTQPISQSSRSLSFEKLISGTTSHQKEASQVLIRNEKEWQTLWQELHSNQQPVSQPPEIKWDQQAVIAAFMGEKPSGGYSIEIEKIEDSNGSAKVFLVHRSPGKACFTTMMMSQPFVIVIISANIEQIQVEVKEEVNDC